MNEYQLRMILYFLYLIYRKRGGSVGIGSFKTIYKEAVREVKDLDD